MRTRAGKSTGWPSRFAGLNFICRAARSAASSRPWPSPLMTRFTWTVPSAWNTKSSTTSPSSLRVRPSAEYCGRGLSRMLTMVGEESLPAAFFLGVLSATLASAKPPLCTLPCFPPLGGGLATPFPNPVLANVRLLGIELRLLNRFRLRSFYSGHFRWWWRRRRDRYFGHHPLQRSNLVFQGAQALRKKDGHGHEKSKSQDLRDRAYPDPVPAPFTFRQQR